MVDATNVFNSLNHQTALRNFLHVQPACTAGTKSRHTMNNSRTSYQLIKTFEVRKTLVLHWVCIIHCGDLWYHKNITMFYFHKVLYRDLDGSLTGLPGGGWVVPNSPLLPDSLCTPSLPVFSAGTFNGSVCDGGVHFLRMAWNQAEPLVSKGCSYITILLFII